jgi:hypothetical protein
MRYVDIKRHLKPFGILAKRKTTINNAFASAIASCDEYDGLRVRNAIIDLGQDPDSDLKCVYCADLAETWDHVFATVRNSEFSGNGHRIGNLLPCCKPCNSKKGNKHWKVFLETLVQDEVDKQQRRCFIESYLVKHHFLEHPQRDHVEYEELKQIKAQVLALLERADRLATRIRHRNAA